MKINPEMIKLIEDYACLPDGSDVGAISLYHDLGIYGDDADELLCKYAATFGVSLADFRFADYFPNEGDSIISLIWRFILRKPRKEYKRLTIADLQRGVDEKRIKQHE